MFSVCFGRSFPTSSPRSSAQRIVVSPNACRGQWLCCCAGVPPFPSGLSTSSAFLFCLACVWVRVGPGLSRFRTTAFTPTPKTPKRALPFLASLQIRNAFVRTVPTSYALDQAAINLENRNTRSISPFGSHILLFSHTHRAAVGGYD